MRFVMTHLAPFEKDELRTHRLSHSILFSSDLDFNREELKTRVNVTSFCPNRVKFNIQVLYIRFTCAHKRHKPVARKTERFVCNHAAKYC